jgi:hypothetical protein
MSEVQKIPEISQIFKEKASQRMVIIIGVNKSAFNDMDSVITVRGLRNQKINHFYLYHFNSLYKPLVYSEENSAEDFS